MTFDDRHRGSYTSPGTHRADETTFTMMDDDAWFELISAAVDGEIDGVEQRTLDGYLGRSEHGRQVHQQLVTTRRSTLLQSVGDVPDLSARILARSAPPSHRGSGPDGGSTIRFAPPTVERVEHVESQRRGHRRRGVWIGSAAAAMAACAVGVVAMIAGGSGNEPDGLAGTPPSPAVTIGMSDTAFDATDVHIPVGTTVHWANHSATVHELVHQLPDASVDGVLRPREERSATIDQPGIYQYWCEIHHNMSGTITVED